MPLDYILFKIMKLLKEHSKETVISREMFSRIVGEFLIESYLSDEVKASLLSDYDFDYDVDSILDDYAYCLSDVEGFLILLPHIKLQDIDDMLDGFSSDYDDELIAVIDEFYDFNIFVLEMIGIKMNKELYKRMIELEGNIEKNYEWLAISQKNDKKNEHIITDNLKKCIFKRKFIFNYLKEVSSEEYNDLYKYSLHEADSLGVGTVDFRIESDNMDSIIEDDPFHRSLFLSDSIKEFVYSESFYASSAYGDDYEMNKELFYIRVIDILEKRVNANEYSSVNERLLFAKYKLMYVIDMLFQSDKKFNGYLFMNSRKNYIDYHDDYSFMEEEIFYLIDELFEYTDDDMNDKVICFENNIKSILLEAYYGLTRDERVIDAIKSHDNYGRYNYINRLFSGIIDKNIKKIRQKGDK